MARVQYSQVGEADVDERLAAVFRGQRTLGGRVTNYHRILGRIPHVYRWYVPFSAAARSSESNVPKRTRLIAEIRTSIVNSCTYCATHTSAMGRKVGMSEAEIDALYTTENLDRHFTAAELAVIAWADTVARNTARRDQQAFDDLRKHFEEVQVIELTVLVAARTMTNRIQEALWTDLEGPDELEEPRVDHPHVDLDHYARTVLCPGPHPPP